MRRLRLILLLAVAHSGWARAGQEADWWNCQQELTKVLWVSNTPIAQLVSRVTEQPVADGPAALFKVALLLRAGMNEQAIDALRQLKEIAPGLSNDQVSHIYHEAVDHEAAWDVAQGVCEIFAENVSSLTLENRLLKHWLESGWTVEQVDQWLAARPPGVGSFWVKERLRFAQSQGRGAALLERLAEGVRRHPGNLTNAVAFLDALIYARQGTDRADLSWLPEVINPVRAVDAQGLAVRLRRLDQWSLALGYFEKAIAAPLKDSDVRELGMMRQVMLSADTLRAAFAAQCREEMAECLLQLGRAEAAQQRMVEAADLRERHQLGPNTLLAGRVQAASGQRTIEGRITEAAKISEDDPGYWRERARYFRGRQEPDREEEALQKALALTKPLPAPERQGKGHADLRAGALGDYAHFLARHGREGEAVTLLRQELADVPATAESSVRAASMLGFDLHKQIKADDAVLWNWLANRPEWGHPEERLLWRMLEQAPKESLDPLCTRAEGLVGDNSSRAYTLGWILNRLQMAQRSIPLLKHAVATATSDEIKQRAAFTLLESFLDTGQWKEAEAIFGQASARLTAFEIPEWHSKLALLAARAGAQADALRLWSRTANSNPTALEGLVELARLGLRDELVAFYQAMRKNLPASHVPARALRLLELLGP